MAGWSNQHSYDSALRSTTCTLLCRGRLQCTLGTKMAAMPYTCDLSGLSVYGLHVHRTAAVVSLCLVAMSSTQLLLSAAMVGARVVTGTLTSASLSRLVPRGWQLA